MEFNVDVHFPKEGRYRRLEDVSPVVKTLARQQFDDYVKRVRIFGHPRVASEIAALDDLPGLVSEAIGRVEG